ncbi:MAG: hypothetical protein WDN45_02135 [Caulobacteraceae bacterium]
MAQSQTAEPLSDQSQILKRFPRDTGVVTHGVKVKLKNGAWLDVTDNPFGKTAPILCWYAPQIHVAGVCQIGAGVTVTTLVELNTGHRASAPGLPMLMPEEGLVAVGPDKARGVDSDSLTVIQVKNDDIIDEGGALFDEDYGPGAWVDGDCYRLTPKGAKGGAWLEKGSGGWEQVTATASTVCQGRHGR